MTDFVEVLEKKECLCTLVGMYTGPTAKEKYYGGYSRNLKENCYVIHYPTSGYIVEGNEIIFPKRDLCPHVHCRIIHSSLDIGTT